MNLLLKEYLLKRRFERKITMDSRIEIILPYWGAWVEFNWEKGVWGFGVDDSRLKDDGYLTIYSHYHKREFVTTKELARKAGRIGKNHPQGVSLRVIPRTAFESREEEHKPIQIIDRSPKPIKDNGQTELPL